MLSRDSRNSFKTSPCSGPSSYCNEKSRRGGHRCSDILHVGLLIDELPDTSGPFFNLSTVSLQATNNRTDVQLWGTNYPGTTTLRIQLVLFFEAELNSLFSAEITFAACLVGRVLYSRDVDQT